MKVFTFSFSANFFVSIFILDSLNSVIFCILLVVARNMFTSPFTLNSSDNLDSLASSVLVSCLSPRFFTSHFVGEYHPFYRL